MPDENPTSKPHHVSHNDPKAYRNKPNKHETIDTQPAFAGQYFLDEQQHWLDSYKGYYDGPPPTRGGKTVATLEPSPKPKPKPAPVNNLK
ncbi:hypothetical protein F5B22DRAFT_632152 [Xylaria bambusicola]|uniref:uncharacterized protein n=1 Tax=Xylaria bambusicola TaxID=326684 RepID=UPI00200776D7|nr:uncharacterized protein F5B22DRAFT_632152 [Xylaria bambusicola]KAI0502756.1 hypothetical protein F5B22DRAFT_632152 [Xylaria bambusicola]